MKYPDPETSKSEEEITEMDASMKSDGEEEKTEDRRNSNMDHNYHQDEK